MCVHHHLCVIPNSLTQRQRRGHGECSGATWREEWCVYPQLLLSFPWCVAYREACNFSLEVSFLACQNYFCQGGRLFQCRQIQWKLLSSSWSLLYIWLCGSLLPWNILLFVATFFSFRLFHRPLFQSSFWAPPLSRSHRLELWTF